MILAGLLVLSVLGHLANGLVQWGGAPVRHGDGPRMNEVVIEDNDASDKIAVIPIDGIIMSGDFGGEYGLVEMITRQLEHAAEDDAVKAVVLKVNSPGGEVLASDEIAEAIEKFQEETGKPVVASMGSLAASGGYYVAAPCRWIVAHELTITGSIGVIMHSYNYRGLMKKVGLTPRVFKSGRFKDMLSGEKDLDQMTPAEREDLAEESRMLQALIDETYARFKSVVARGRAGANAANKESGEKGQPLSANWTDYADGRVLSGREAHRIGLVDELGGLETAVARARKLVGIESANLISYHPVFDLSQLFHIFGRSEGGRVQVDLGFDLPRLRPGHLYFLSPTYLH
ncbi:MAG TPA: signal peptide peptidase SppA [Methylomirabilota bacterium]|nr:signal peptide peptidase SppA [Methylomirabilota bacterium]